MLKFLNISGLAIFLKTYISALAAVALGTELEKGYFVASSLLSLTWLVFKILNEIKKYCREKREKNKP